jgi:hypothetical protein
MRAYYSDTINDFMQNDNIPKGDAIDQTRAGKYYDGTYQYLKSLGIGELNSNNFSKD